MKDETLTHLEWQRERASREDEWSQRQDVGAALDRGSRALSETRQDYQLVADLLVETLVPSLLGPNGEHLHYYDREVGDRDGWHWVALTRFLEEPEAYRRSVGRPTPRETPSIDTLADGGSSVASQPRETVVIERAFESVAEVADYEDIISDVSNVSRAVGFELTLGRYYSPKDWDHGDEVQIISRNRGHPKTLTCGSTGAGKSATLESVNEDRYNNGVKIIDLVDTDEYENCLYDVPQSDPELRDVREEDLDLPVDFTESDELKDPDLEILLPLTPSLRHEPIPFDEDGETVVRPFTIPASDLDQTTLVSFLSALVSRQQEASLRTAYDTVDRREDDWSLEDLAREIADQEELKDSFRKRVVRLLENLQNKGFIRTRECEYAIDWREIFESTETITAFSQAHVSDRIDQLMICAYLVYSTYFKRRDFHALPEAVVSIRELHEVAPHREESDDDARAEALQSAMVSNLSYALKKNRHQRIEYVCDTQDLQDLKRGVRKRFSRYLCFDMPKGPLEDVFDYVSEKGADSASKSMGSESGMGAVVGLSEPNVQDDVSFLSPVQFAPPSHHHFDVDEHGTGFRARADLTDEDLRTPEWVTGVPGSLKFDSDDILEVEEGESAANVPPGIDSWVHECIRFVDGERTQTSLVRESYNSFAESHGFDTRNARSFGQQFTKLEGVETVKSGSRYYAGVLLNDRGREYMEADQ